MSTNDPRTPLLTPLLQLARSRKAVVALITATINLVVVFAPSLEPHRAELLTFSLALWTVLSAVLINSIAKEDAAKVTPPAETPRPAPETEAKRSGQG